MSFNPEPSKQAVEILFSNRKTKTTHTFLFLNGIIVNNHKHLGLILDSKLSFSKHLNDKINKSRKLLGVLKFLLSYLPLCTLNQIYKMYIHPHLDYCDIIYQIPATANHYISSITLHPLMESIECIQDQAALIITCACKASNRNKLYDKLVWESLSDHRWSRRGLTPNYLIENLPSKRRLLYQSKYISPNFM